MREDEGNSFVSRGGINEIYNEWACSESLMRMKTKGRRERLLKSSVLYLKMLIVGFFEWMS